MTEKVNPSINRKASAYKTAGAIAHAGGSQNGWVSPPGEPSDISAQDGDIDQSVLNAFEETSSSNSFGVTIDPGEAFVFGSWVVTDTSTSVTLASGTNDQTVYVGWNKDSADDTIVGLESIFDTASGTTDEKIPLYDFDTDGSGVTSVTDRRRLTAPVWETVSVSGDYDAHRYENVLADASSTGITVTLPQPTTDMVLTVKVTDASNDVTIATPGGETIDGDASRTLSAQYTALTIAADGNNYYIV